MAEEYREIGRIRTLNVGVRGDRVCLYDVWELDAAERDEFMRLWCEAERQAEAAGDG